MTEGHVYGERLWLKVRRALEYLFISVFNPLLDSDSWVHRNMKYLQHL